MPDVPRSHVPGIRWPALLDDEGAKLLAVQHTLQQTQWWSAERLRAHQQMQLCEVVRHAVRSVPHYRASRRMGSGRRADVGALW